MQASFVYQLDHLNFSYRKEEQHFQALSQLQLKIPRGSISCLCGPSGSGKTTLLNILGFIEPIQDGQFLFDQQDVRSLGENKINEIRRKDLGFVFQHFNLFPVLSAYENVDYFLHRQSLSQTERKERVEWILNAVGLWEKRHQKPSKLSGGQQQRVALARAFVKKPKVIIADEPTASLDQKTGRDIMNLFLELNENIQTTIILSSHDLMVQGLVQTKIEMEDGRVL